MGGAGAIVKPICSALVAILGTLTNTLSLSYFASNREKRDLDFLLMLLNAFDLIVCVAAFLVGAFYQINSKMFKDENMPLMIAMNTSIDLFTAAIQCTGFATCILSSTRLILFWKPFHKLSRLAIKIAVGVYVAIMVVSTVIFDILGYKEIYSQGVVGWWSQLMDLINLALMLSLVFLFSLSTLVLLARKNYDTIPGDTAFMDAATTVFILSALFCLLNAFYVITPIVCVTSTKLQTGSDACDVGGVYPWMMTWIALPLNSALNPVIYFSRSRNMRQFFEQAIRRIVRCPASEGYICADNDTHHTLVSKAHTTAL